MTNKSSGAKEMLNILRREAGEAQAQLLADICDLCHWPWVETEETLPARCCECDIADDLEALLVKTRAVATGDVMAIVAEEMHVVRENGDGDG